MKPSHLAVAAFAWLSLGAATDAAAIDKFVYHPTFFHVIDESFEAAYGQDMVKLEQIVNAELDILQQAGVDAIFAPSPRTLGNRRKRFERTAQLAMGQGFDVYMPVGHELRVYDEFDATNEFSSGQYLGENPILYTGVYIDEPIVNNRPSWLTTQMAVEGKDRGRPVIVVFGGKNEGQFQSFLTNLNWGTPVPGKRLLDYVDILAVDDYSRAFPRGFSTMASITNANGKQFMGIVGETYKRSVSHMSTQTNYARSLGASSIALWTMDGLENGREADRLDACDSTSYYQSFDKYYHGGLPFTHIQCWDYGQLSFETCVDGAQTGSGPDCDEDVHGYDWGIRTIVNDLPATWAWWSGV